MHYYACFEFYGVRSRINTNRIFTELLYTEYQYAWYSGMMPGAISGLYKSEETQMDLAALSKW